MSGDKLDIKLLAMDVDGVLTDGGLILHADGTESKRFHVKDGAWLRIWKRQGLMTAFITGKESIVVAERARDLQIDFVYQRAHYKVEAFAQLLKDSQVSAEQIAYIGDDVIDLPVMRQVGLSAAVADALPEVCEIADFVTKRPGGHGAVQEFIGYLLKRMGLLQQAMERYLVRDEV